MKLQEDTSIFEFDPAGAAEVAHLRLLDVVVWLKFPSRRFAAAGIGAPVFSDRWPDRPDRALLRQVGHGFRQAAG